MTLVLLLAIVAWIALGSVPVLCSETVPDTAANQVRYAYLEPTSAAHRSIYEQLKQLRILERLTELLSPFRLPHVLTLKVQSCAGRVNAFYWDYEITACYEYFDFLLKNVPADAKSGELTRHDALIGMTVDVFLHETGHAVFDMLQIPFLGHEEDAADQFASYIELHFAKEDARRLLLGVALLAREQGRKDLERMAQAQEFADVHGLPAQRYFNVLCMAYGSDPDFYAGVIVRGRLPTKRAKNCRYEYRRFEFGFRKLILPHVDETLLEQVKSKSWFRFDAANASVNEERDQ
jgi:Putative metallopeptidase